MLKTPRNMVADLMKNLGSLMTMPEEKISRITRRKLKVDSGRLERIKLVGSKVNRSKNLMPAHKTSNRPNMEIMAKVLQKMLCMISFSNRLNSENDKVFST